MAISYKLSSNLEKDNHTVHLIRYFKLLGVGQVLCNQQSVRQLVYLICKIILKPYVVSSVEAYYHFVIDRIYSTYSRISLSRSI